MTVIELQELFRTQLICDPAKVFYMKQQGGPEIHQITAQVLSHDVKNNTFADLMADLAGYSYQDSVGNDLWPRFKKDEE